MKLGIVAAAIAAIAVAAAVAWPRIRPGGAPAALTAEISSLAVLPFVNNSGSADKEFIADGMTESLIRNLSQLPTLKVISRNSVFRFKGQNADAQKVGAQLGVRAVMTGTVGWVDDQLVIDIELMNADDASVILSRRYLQQTTRVLAMESDISQDVVKSLRLKLTGGDERELTKEPTKSAEAYQFFLRGRFFQNQMSPASLRQAIEQYELAVRADPAYAQAYASLAAAYLTLGTYFESPKDDMTRARAYAKQALGIDPALVDAHMTVGMVNLLYDWDWAAAAHELTSTAGVKSEAVETFSCTAHLLQATGHVADSEHELHRALDLDPLSIELNTEIGCNAYYRRAYDEAVRGYENALKLDPRNEVAYYGLGRSYGQKQMYQKALEEMQRVEAVNGEASPLIIGERGYTYAKAGRTADARRIIDTLTATARRGVFVDPYFFATVYVGLGENDRVFDWLNKAYDERSGFLPSLSQEPKWDTVRSDPRFQTLVTRMGLS